MIDAFRKTYQYEGVRGLYKVSTGSLQCVVRCKVGMSLTYAAPPAHTHTYGA